MSKFWQFLWFVFGICTAMIGYQIHHSVFWSICDFIFTPLAWVKWLICHEVTIPVIKSAFSWIAG
jgi:hypothetical protein